MMLNPETPKFVPKRLREAFDEARASEEKYSKVIDDLFRDREHVDVVASSDTATDLRKLLDVAIRSDGEVKDRVRPRR